MASPLGRSASGTARALRWARRTLSFFLVLTVFAARWAWTAPLPAHETLLRSTPAKDSLLPALPTELRLTFSAAVTASLSRIVLLGPDSSSIALDSVRRHADSASVLIAGIRGPLGAGRHTVVWQIAGADGHPVRGSFSFTILPEAVPAADPVAAGSGRDTDVVHTHGEPELPTEFDTGSPLYAIIRWLNFVGILGVIGAVGLELLVLRRIRGAAVVGEAAGVASLRAARLGLTMVAIAAVAAVLRLGAQTYALQLDGGLDLGVTRTALFGSRWGAGWLTQMISLIVAGVGLTVARRAGRGWIIAAIGAAGLALSLSLAGHASTAPRPLPATVLDVLHVVAAGGWLGTLLALVVAGLPAVFTLSEDRRGTAAAAMVNAFSPAALIFAGIAVVTGIFAIGTHMGIPPGFTTTAYGRTLLVKLGAFALVCVAGAWNWKRVRPRLAEPGLAPHLRRTGTLELVLAGLVLAATAVLVATPPPGH